ncbi:MAG: hypothetical protein QOD06_3444 [Candidatus Binatota bacterium]|jgi:hypothetical protein|nr:hypothetical protein [Candidatus Binatota bacterium]
MPVDPFDAALAEFPARRVPVAVLVDPLEVTHAPERIAAFGDAMRRGDRFPPIAVVRLGGRLFVADGHKRFAAFRAVVGSDIVGESEILVQVWPLRRWLRDQWRQLTHKTRQQIRVAARVAAGTEGRDQARRLAMDTVGHWRRIAVSLARLVRAAFRSRG